MTLDELLKETERRQGTPTTQFDKDTEGVQPFHCGSQYADWVDHNCSRCAKFDPEVATGECAIDDALGMAYLGDGLVTYAIAERMGYTALKGHVLVWDCPEREPLQRSDRRGKATDA